MFNNIHPDHLNRLIYKGGAENPSAQPTAPRHPMELGDRPKETPEQKTDKTAKKVLSEYDMKVRDAKDSKEAEEKVKEATEKLDKVLKADQKLTASLPDDYKNTYERVYAWASRPNDEGYQHGAYWSVTVEKVNGKLQASYMIAGAWNSAAGEAP